MSFLNEIQQFSKEKLKATETFVTVPSGDQYVETRDCYGRIQSKHLVSGQSLGYLQDLKGDTQVGEILPGLILGSQDVAADTDILQQYKVTHILNVASMVENLYPDQYTYCSIQILDLPETCILDHFKESFAFIEEALSKHGCVLVHCNAGVSRSASIVIGFLMEREKWDFQKAYDYVKLKRPATRPNDGFMKQLKQYKPCAD